jgi:hypothetical protein
LIGRNWDNQKNAANKTNHKRPAQDMSHNGDQRIKLGEGRTIPMLLTIAIRVPETMFVLGAVGSAIVVVLTAVEDSQMLFVKDKKTTSNSKD